jgi:hypothetical protein
VFQKSFNFAPCSARIGHGAGLLTRVIRPFQPDERRTELLLDPWGQILQISPTVNVYFALRGSDIPIQAMNIRETVQRVQQYHRLPTQSPRFLRLALPNSVFPNRAFIFKPPWPGGFQQSHRNENTAFKN